MLINYSKIKKIKLLMFVIFLFNFNLKGQIIEEIDLSLIDLLEANKCFIQILPKYEYYIVTEEYLAPNDKYSLEEVKKFYDLKIEIIYRNGDTVLSAIHPAEYQIIYDTLEIKKNNELKIIESIRGDTIFEFFEVSPTDTLLIQCSKCKDLNRINLFNAFCKTIQPAKFILNKKYLKKSTQILYEEIFPKRIINRKYEMIKPPYAEYKYLPKKILSTVMVAKPKTEKAPKEFVQKKKRLRVKYLKPYACYSGWNWNYFICSSCNPELIIYNNGKILELQKRLQELAYPIKLTNIVDDELIKIIKEMDLKALKNNELMKCARELVKDFEKG
jgi:hypothetical protein